MLFLFYVVFCTLWGRRQNIISPRPATLNSTIFCVALLCFVCVCIVSCEKIVSPRKDPNFKSRLAGWKLLPAEDFTVIQPSFAATKNVRFSGRGEGGKTHNANGRNNIPFCALLNGQRPTKNRKEKRDELLRSIIIIQDKMDLSDKK